MKDLTLGGIAALLPEFAVKDLPLGRTLMIREVSLAHSVFLLKGKVVYRDE